MVCSGITNCMIEKNRYLAECTPTSVVEEQVKSNPSIQGLVKTMYKLVKSLYFRKK